MLHVVIVIPCSSETLHSCYTPLPDSHFPHIPVPPSVDSSVPSEKAYSASSAGGWLIFSALLKGRNGH